MRIVFGPDQAETVWLRHHDRMLYVAFRNRQDPHVPLKKEPAWETNHSVEVALRRDPNTAIAVLRGYLDGGFESSALAGTSATFAEAMNKGSLYAVRVVPVPERAAEWRTPLAPLALPRDPEINVDANVALHRADNGNEWICW